MRGIVYLLARIQLDTLRDYSEDMEESIKTKAVSNSQELQELAKDYYDHELDQFWDNSSDRIQQLYTDYPNLLRSSILTSCITCLEKTFIQIHTNLQNDTFTSKPVSLSNKKLSGSVIEKVVQSVNEIYPLTRTLNLKEWNDLILNIKIRNRVIHDNGQVHPAKYKKLFQNIKQIELDNSKTVALSPYHELLFLENFSKSVIGVSLKIVGTFIDEVRQHTK
ncbi:hypothetical protein [Paenibacillus odorifer]|uniref:RiboL-PSP-HEPN domain-containing protein n=1 Tax=Paenibacillus odorifer TaxID=189426 RepID=A0A1R0WSG1_9BACL|nr:hypothetical protein [Paenibacillus odorifer]OMD20337.1 hypothetical protein BJP51_09645 [Paenibacillus odorifer]OMD70876.1 hypothetical protein BSK48_14060 [Paenibacillus odorifer]